MSNANSFRQKLNHFTKFSFAMSILQDRRLLLANTESWPDKNDKLFLELYKQAKRLTTLRVLCFTDEGETIHDWSTFAAGPDGCCIQFDRPILEERLRELSVKGVRSQKVDHLTIDQVNRKIADHSCRLEDLPFMKRYPFRCENEFRIICESTQSLTCDEIDFVPQAITKVTLSETLSEPDFNLRLKNIRSLEGFEHLEVNRSTLNDNSPWRDAGLRYIHAARENLPTPQAT